ncbi:MAG: patatin family protein [Brevundimonas sp.]|nr:MAG: patatin family protein [Brevundimonas sp.]
MREDILRHLTAGKAPASSVRTGAALVIATQLILSACATPQRLAAVPSADTARAMTTIPDARFFPDRDPEAFVRMMGAAANRELAARGLERGAGPLPPVSYLTISGGGGDGAFGAGLLVGWTEAGTRPTFKYVTGISTGALIAPFAFLGSDYDPILKETYTQVTDDNIFRKRDITALMFSDAMADTTPMAEMVSRYVTRDLLDRIAAEYARGRLLFIGTTDLDAREAVYWNMGAIATSQDPAALELFRKITLASAAIPGAFPPIMIDVTVDGQPYQEMHVDGGASRQVFLYPPAIHLRDLATEAGLDRDRHLYIIRNSRLDPDWASVDRRLMSIVNRSVSALIHAQGLGDLNRMFLTSRRDGLDYHLAYIPRDFMVVKTSEFDSVYMNALFERGRTMAAAGYVWDKFPPGYAPEDAVTIRQDATSSSGGKISDPA